MNNQVTDYTKALWYPSSSFDERKEAIKYVVIHGTWVATTQIALNDFLCNPEIEVSAHYLIDEQGKVYQLVLEEKRAWHAGMSKWKDDEALNHTSIGIEIQNKGEESGEAYTEAQYAAVQDLLKDIMLRHHISPEHVLAHSDIATDRKEDPGAHFNWKKLEDHALAAPWHVKAGEPLEVLRTYGWHGTDTDIIKAFQRRYLPEKVSGELCTETRQKICGA